MPSTTFSAISTRNSDLIRKTLDAVVFVGAMTITPPTAITTASTSDLQTLPTGYKDIGWMDASNAVNLATGVTASPVDSFGSLYPTRSDITKMTQTITVTAQETKAVTMGLYSQVDMTSVTADATTSEIIYADPVRPSTIFYRLLIMWVDNSGTDSIYGAISFPRVSVTGVADMKLMPGTDVMARGLTFTSYPDATLGHARKNYLGGPGIAARKTAMGF